MGLLDDWLDKLNDPGRSSNSNDRNSSDSGIMYQRGPQGQAPKGISVTDLGGGNRRDYGTVGKAEHTSAHGDGWHRSWNNPGGTNDHSTDHATGKITEH